MAARPETHMSSSSSSSSSESYEVFLSFRGEDTRGNFTDHLYSALNRAGIRTFRDNEELHKGKEIGQGLMNAIIKSKISIPVFSENYASSKWCLKELAQIMKCMENDGQIVLPVFYKVNPSDIRNQTGRFAEAFLDHEKTQPKGCVDSWREALKQAGSLKGEHYEKPEQSEADTIKSIVEDVWNKLKKTTALHVGEHLIGIDSRVDKVIRLLDLESQDVRYMGICGIGGLGKTTIARAVFNKICCRFRGDSQGLSFLEDVSSTSQQVDGLVKLQNKLVSSILGNNLGLDNVAQGITIIKERFRYKKVLIILDDVDRVEQLRALAGHPDWFGFGSRIIITAREEHILQVKQVETKIYKPEILNDEDSLQLFSNHAFGKDQPPKTFMLLSRKVVEFVRGLPLAIEVLGSFLRDESCHNEWERMVDSFQNIPHNDIQRRLQISYDRLNTSEKKIFLDIACFFIGMDKEIVIHILEDVSPENNIKVLVRKSLVSIDNNKKLRMHDLLRDMGREIVRQENPENARERTRLWSHVEALDVLKNNEGTSSVEGLSFVRHDDPVNYASDSAKTDHCLKNEAFKPMSDLRLLQVDGAYFDGNFDALSTKLKWLSWKGIPSECILSISHLRKLSVLDLSESKITEYWNGWQHIQKVKTLKVLDLGGCRLTRTPDFSYNTGLQRLILDGCWSLVACDESIGCLKKLVYLTLKDCRKIKELPDSICKLSSLTNLILSGCTQLEKLPKALGDMKSLTELMIDETDIEELPVSIGSLETLVSLSAKDCVHIKELPDSICKLSSLTNLILSDCCKLEKLPKALGDMKSLTELMIDGTDIEELPDSIGSLQKLVSLSAEGCKNIKGLPDSICKLSSLTNLILSYCCKLEKLPKALGDMKSLTELMIDGTDIEELPDSIGSLQKLVRLSAEGCKNIKGLPDSICKLSSLTNLILSDCRKLEKLPKALGDMKSLTELNIDWTDIEELPDSIGSLQKLVRLSAEDCSKLARIPRSMGKLRRLQYINLLRSCVDELPEGFGNLWSLKTLKMGDANRQNLILFALNAMECYSLESLPNMSNFKSLERLSVDHSEKLAKIQDLNGLSLLQELVLTNCKMLQSLPELPSSLIRLNIRDCSSVESLPNLSNLKILEEIHLFNCEKLTEIEGLNGLSLLQKLDFRNCQMLQSLPELPPTLTRLHIEGCKSMESLPNLSNLKILERLCLNGCGKLAKIEGMGALSLLKQLDLQACVMLQSLPELPPSLILIDIRYCNSMERLANLSSLKNLEHLYLDSCEKLIKIEGMKSLSLLPLLVLQNCKVLQSLPELPSILTKLQVRGCMKLSEIEGIIGLSRLKVLHLDDCRELRSLPDLSNLKKLEQLLLKRCDNLVEIRGLESLESLTYFHVLRCNTYIKTLQKCVTQGMLGRAFHEENIQKINRIPNNDENIKGMVFLLVYQTPPQLLRKPFHLKVVAEIKRNDGKRIRCCHELQIEGMTGTGVDGYYSCYFHGLTWFGLPLRKQYIIEVTELGYLPEEPDQEANEVRMKMFVIIPEYETREDSQELEKRIAPLITCTSVESEGVGRDKKPDDDADRSTWFTLGGGEGQGPISWFTAKRRSAEGQ